MRLIAIKAGLLCLLLAAAAAPAGAQERTVTGTVTDAATNLGLPGVNIVVQGTTIGTTSDIEGEYSIEVPGPDAVLVYSFVGYETQEVLVGDRTQIDVALTDDVAALEELVVVGYGSQRREDITGSVATIDAEDANVGLVTSPDQLIQGRVAGVSIVQNNGEPGAGFQIRIRGGTSISASNEPLYVIDGVPIDNVPTLPGGANVSNAAPRNPLAAINPNDIASISILKDAAATAIYGSRAANGVILITTKKGSAGRVEVNYEGYVSASTMANELDLVSAAEYRAFVEEQVEAGVLGETALENIGTAETDWQEAVTQTGVSQFHNLSFAGGATNTQYRASVSYLDQQGIVIDSGQERLTSRINASNTSLGDRLRVNLNLSGVFVNDDFLPYQQTGGFEGGLFTNVFAFNPTLPVRANDGSYFEIGPGRQSVRNPVALARQVDDVGNTTRLLGNLSAELDLIEGLTAQVSVGADRSDGSRNIFFPRTSPVGAEFGGQAIRRNRERTTQTLQTLLTYRPTLGEAHTTDFLAGYEFNEYNTEEFGAESRDFVTDFWRYNNLGGGAEEQKPYSFRETSRLVSFFGRANYTYDDRYSFSAVLRYDGSSRFGSGNKWGLFPAISAAWRISEESFLQGDNVITDLRLRVGYGLQGNQEIGNYASLALLTPDPGARAVLGGSPITGVAPSTFANPNLRWEESRQFNIGLDYGFLSGKYSGTVEYFYKNTFDLLLTVPVPQPAVVPFRLENIGEIRNQGIEFSLDALALDRPETSLIVGVVASALSNEVVDLGTREEIITGTVSGRGQSGVQAQIIRPGEPVPSFYGPVFTGIVDGAQQFADLDGDGVVESTGDDRTIIGNPRPDFTAGIRSNLYWRAFDLAVFFRGEFGRDVFNNTALVYETKSGVTQNNNFLASALEDQDAVTEAPKFSSRWIEDGSFFRLQNVTLGYTLDLQNLTTYGRTARVWLSADNIFVITPYSGYDPEVNTNAGLATLGIDYTNYPRPRTFTLGLRLGF